MVEIFLYRKGGGDFFFYKREKKRKTRRRREREIDRNKEKEIRSRGANNVSRVRV